MKHINPRAAVYAALIGLVCLVSMAAIDPQHVGMSGLGVRGQQAGFNALGSGGNASAGWDTVTVIFHTQARATGGLFPNPASATAADTTRIGDLNRRLLGRGAYSIRGGADDVGAAARSDSAICVRLGTGFACPTFAWTNLKENDTDGYYPAQYQYIRSDVRQVINSTAYLQQQIGADGGNRTIPMFYIPFENHIPAGSTIVSAVANFDNFNAMYYANPDTIIATLLTSTQDNDWYTVKGGTGVTNSPNFAKASWLYQNDTNAVSGTAWGGSQANAWTPTLADRNYYWNMGSYSDWSGSLLAGGGNFAAGVGINVDITNCVQASVTGVTNNGIMALWQIAGTVTSEPLLYGWDNYSTAIGRNPYVVVKYITKRYQKPFGTSDLAFVFTTDDFNEGANSAFTDTFNAHGGVYTMFGARKHVDSPSGKQSGMDSLLTWLGQGFEIGAHSRQHRDPDGLVYWEKERPGDVWDDTARGQVWFDAEPLWLHALADSATGDSLKSHPQFGKSMALPNNTISMGVQRVLADLGYLSVRYMPVNTYDRTKYLRPPTHAPAYGDTAMNVAAQAQRRPRNMMMLPYNMTAPQLVGPPTRSEVAADSMRHNMRRALHQWRGQGRGDMTILTHDVKHAHPLNSGFGYLDGINPAELGAMLDVVDEIGARYMTASDLGRWRRATAEAIDTPTGFYNAVADDDSARYEAADRVWYKPDGIDNRWIRGVRTPTAVVSGFDVTPPLLPTGLIAVPGDGVVDLTWTASASDGPKWYKVYRFFDGAADTTLLTTTATTSYSDGAAVNGSPHNYFVTAIDAAANESQDSDHVATTPGTILAFARPVYFGFWYQDPDVTAFDQSTIDSLAVYDAIVTGPFANEGATSEPAYAAGGGLLRRLRSASGDSTVVLTYFDGFTIPSDGGLYPAGSAIKRIWDYCVAADGDSSGFAETDADGSEHTVGGDVYDTKFFNVTYPDLADTIAHMLVDVYAETGVDGEYAGFFVDDVDTTLSDWMCNSGACDDFIDYDQDGAVFSADAGEKTALKQFQIDLLRGIRREFAQRDMPNRLIVPNTTFGRKATPNLKDEEYMALVDGMLNEAWNVYWPGNATATNTDTWDLTFNWRNLLVHEQTSPPLVLWNARADSSQQYMNEVMALAHGGFIGAQKDGDSHGELGAPYLDTRSGSRLPAPGTSGVVTYGEVAANASPDTLTVTWPNYTGRMILGQAYADSFAVWPYIIYNPSTNDTLSISRYWERAADTGAPTAVQFAVSQATGDNYVDIEISAFGSGDFSHFNIYRSLTADLNDMVLLDAEAAVDKNGLASFVYRDSTADNGTEYCYSVTAEDYSGNEGPLEDFDCATPSDATAPPVPQSVVAAGGSYYVDVDWLYATTPADFLRFRVWRALGEGAFALHDSVTVSAHQDSTAISGQDYRYYIVALDDDGNASAPSDTVTGGWIGSPTATYLAPQLVRVVPNYTATSTAVLVYPPTDVTGLTGYTVYRGPWNGLAATDTTVCIKRISINATPDAYNAHTYIDNTANTDPDSAFQYTAVALYSGHRSVKYSPPAGAFTDGGFAATTPTVGAFGNGTNILLVVGSVAGADSTRVYRGTSSGTQTSLASINALDNPYTDTTAAANTDYWYKVRQYDVSTATWSNYSAVSGPVRWTSVPSGDPSISSVNDGVDDEIQNGETVVIGGSGFGLKSTAAPLVFEDFEGGEDGAYLAVANGWDDIGHDYDPYKPRHTTARKHGGAKSGLLDFSNWNTESSMHVTSSGFAQEFYIDGWYQYQQEPSAPWSRVNKLFVMFGNGEGFQETPNLHLGTSECTQNPSYHPAGAASVSPSVSTDIEYPFSIGDLTGQFHHIQFWARASSDGQHDGAVRVWLDGVLVAEDMTYLTVANNVGDWEDLRIGYYHAHDAISGCPASDGDAYAWWDDLYIDNSQARVELGTSTSNPSNPTYAQCDHREIQIPSAWSATSVTITANTGAFDDGNVYLFVIDADGTPSPGQLVTIDNP